jgi:hypothetical protein
MPLPFQPHAAYCSSQKTASRPFPYRSFPTHDPHAWQLRISFVHSSIRRFFTSLHAAAFGQTFMLHDSPHSATFRFVHQSLICSVHSIQFPTAIALPARHGLFGTLLPLPDALHSSTHPVRVSPDPHCTKPPFQPTPTPAASHYPAVIHKTCPTIG